MAYDPATIERKWQNYWRDHASFEVSIDPNRPKYYVLDMFPYPSGEGLHVGHPEGYTATDIMARYKRMRGFNVLHPMGWDAFGLPAEQYAIKTGTHPRVTTQRNIDNFRRQIRSLGFSYDWSREIDTTAPEYTRWTQWIFERLYDRGLAYQAEVPVNWCPKLGTVLANEEVIGGRSERGGHPVVRVPLRQWMLRITEYAQRLLDDLEDLDWPEPVKKMQREWIGRSEGARVRFPLETTGETDGEDGEDGESIEVFTTRPDTLFGATYMVLAPEHPLVDRLTTPDRRETVERYRERASRRSERARIAEAEEKSGVFTGALARNPVNGKPIPIWIADYVLAGYGTGAIMAVPAHDERDYAFARRFELPIIEVVSGGDIGERAYTGDGVNVNSGFLDGLSTPEAKRTMNGWLEEHGVGESAVTYKLRDWLFSRQRYWGEPFPLFHHPDGSVKLVPESDLPITLPELEDFQPTGENFEAPLARVRSWIEVVDPETGEGVRRDPNTMPQWAGSCWYFLRFLDPHNQEEPWSKEAEAYWMPVDLYVGGAEHAVLHLLYARFWHKVFYDLGLVHTKEPFRKLVNQGMILGESYRYWDDNLDGNPDAQVRFYCRDQVRDTDEGPCARDDGTPLAVRFVEAGRVRFDKDTSSPFHSDDPQIELERVVEKMSKSRGNVVNPDEVIAKHGADAMRLYEMFIGPLEKAAPWSTDGINGVSGFLARCWRLIVDDESGAQPPMVEGAGTPEQARLTARSVAGVTRDIEAMRFNTAISKLMVYAREITRDAPLPREAAQTLVLLLSPLAPHIAEELWQRLGHATSLTYEAWPEADPALLVDEQIKIVVQVNGKKRDEVSVPRDALRETIEEIALASEKIRHRLDGRAPRKIVVVPGRLVNIVV